MKNITIKTIPHKKQRYDTCGDYVEDNKGNITIFVSDCKNPDFEFLVAIHELAELWLCQKRGIKFEDIDKFDIEFARRRSFNSTAEPGDDPKSPYKNEHCLATGIERFMCALLEADWKQYEDTINFLKYKGE